MIDRNAYRDPLEVLAEEFAQRTRAGETVSVEEYALANREIAGDIRRLFPMLLEMEQLRSRKLAAEDLGDLDVQPPTDLFGYGIIREIGRGAMGVVYEAEEHALGRRVAIKVFPHHSRPMPHHLGRFQSESRTAARLHHTNIVPIFGVGEQDGLHYYVMQHIDGITLEELIRKGRHANESVTTVQGDPPSSQTAAHPALWPAIALELLARMAKAKAAGRRSSRVSRPWWTIVADFGMQVSRALDYAHQQGVVHGDIKPSNLILDPNGTVWITDFGLARALQRQEGSASEIAGTPRFMSPEHLAGNQTFASDLYSLGITLYELATLEPAFRETDRTKLAQQIAAGALQRPTKFAPDMPRDLEAILLKASARDAQTRYLDARSLTEDLARFVEGKPVLARRNGVTMQTWRWIKRHPVNASLSALLVIVLVSSFALISTRWRLAVAEKERAESNLTLAIQSIDRMLDRFTSTSTTHPTATESMDGEAVSMNLPVRFDVSDRNVTALRDALYFYDQFAERNPVNPQLKREITRVHQRTGDIYVRLGQYANAVRAYQLSLANLDWDRGDLDLDVSLTASRILNLLGSALYSASRFTESEDAFRRSQRILSVHAEKNDPSCQAELARSFTNLGQTQSRMGQIRQARASHRRGVRILEQLTQQHRHDANLRLALAIAYRGFYPFVSRDNDREERVRVQRAAIDILEELVREFPDANVFQYELCETLTTTLPRRGSPMERREQLEKGLEIATALNNEYPDVPRSRLLRANALKELARTHNGVVADQLFSESIDTYESLTRDFSEVPAYHVLLGMTLLDRARRLNEARRSCEALECLMQGADEQQRYVDLLPDSRFGQRMLDVIHRELAATARRLGLDPLPNS